MIPKKLLIFVGFFFVTSCSTLPEKYLPRWVNEPDSEIRDIGYAWSTCIDPKSDVPSDIKEVREKTHQQFQDRVGRLIYLNYSRFYLKDKGIELDKNGFLSAVEKTYYE